MNTDSYTEEERFETAYELIEELKGSCVDFRLVDGKVRFRPASRINEHGRAELKRCKAEVYEILREEEDLAVWWGAKLADQPEMDPLPGNEYEELCEILPPRDP